LARKLHYFLIYKPYKVLSQFSDEDGNPGLGSVFNLPKGVYPVGRLDLDSEGLLILTNDKTLNHRLLDPKHGHQRTYWVEVDGIPEKNKLEELRNGVAININGKTHITLPAIVERPEVSIPEREPPVNRIKHRETSWLSITLTEGKNRQVRKMTAKIGHPTLRLLRVGIEQINLFPMQPGDLKMISRNALYKKLGLD
jgi:23S rRNA pseudouridine2457 synthase